jgi:GDPmannose 4,6-dehydratase
LGDARKAKAKLNWEPKITFDKLVEEMVLNDESIAKAQSKSVN